MAEPITRELLKARYDELCAQRDATNERLAPLKAELIAAADEAEVYRVKAEAVSKRLSEARGGMAWIALKKEIGLLAKALGGK